MVLMHWFNQVRTLDRHPSCSWLSLAGCQRAAVMPSTIASSGDIKQKGGELLLTWLPPHVREGCLSHHPSLHRVPAGVMILNQITCLLQSSKEGIGFP